LDIRCNDFRVLSGALPTNLKKLYASSNPLSDWPKDLPAGLETLDIGGNNLGNVTNKLPESLTTFSVHDARNFTALPNPLPLRLKVLGVENTGLRALPDNLPLELQVLLASGSKLNASPGNLPPCLEILDVRDTDIDPAALLQLMQNNTSIISLATPTDDPVLQKKLDEKLQENRERLERAKHVDMRTRPASITAVPANRASMPDPVDGSLPTSSIPANLQDHDALAPDGSKDL
jgi:Leucine-rich repeat (LRR) protein